jgi:ankyrin repeat protein
MHFRSVIKSSSILITKWTSTGVFTIITFTNACAQTNDIPQHDGTAPSHSTLTAGQGHPPETDHFDMPGTHTRYLLINTLLSGDRELLDAMLSRGMDLNRQDHRLGYSVVHELSLIGNRPAVKLCLESGANPDLKSPRTGTFPLYDCISGSRVDLFQVLLDGGADPNQPEDRYGNTTLHAVIQDRLTTHAALLLKHEADTDKANRMGLTPLLLSISMGVDPITTILLEHGADPAKPSSKGVYPLDVAERRKRKAVTRLLRKHGAIKSHLTKGSAVTKN